MRARAQNIYEYEDVDDDDDDVDGVKSASWWINLIAYVWGPDSIYC